MEVINQREETRGDRLKGSAEHWLNSFDFQNECDFIFDTSDKTPDDIISHIIGRLNFERISTIPTASINKIVYVQCIAI